MNKTLNNIEDFQKYVAEHVLQFAPNNGKEYECIIANANKVNASFYGVIIGEKNSPVRPRIYLESYYDEYKNGITMSLILQHIILDAIDGIANIPSDVATSDFSWLTFESVKKLLYPVVISTKRNKCLLSEIPHIDVANLHLSIIVKVDCSNYIPDSSIMVTQRILQAWDVSIEQLYQIASVNISPCLYKISVPLQNDLFMPRSQPIHEKLEPFTLYSMTTENFIFGAALFLKKGLMKKLSEISGTNFYILPSSLHDVLILPVFERTISEDFELFNTVKSTNATDLEPEDILDDALYYYDRNTDEFSYITV